MLNNACPACKKYGRPVYKMGTCYSTLPSFRTIYNFFTVFGLGKNVLPIFHFTMLADLLLPVDEDQN